MKFATIQHFRIEPIPGFELASDGIMQDPWQIKLLLIQSCFLSSLAKRYANSCTFQFLRGSLHVFKESLRQCLRCVPPF